MEGSTVTRSRWSRWSRCQGGQADFASQLEAGQSTRPDFGEGLPATMCEMALDETPCDGPGPALSSESSATSTPAQKLFSLTAHSPRSV